jgi:transposase
MISPELRAEIRRLHFAEHWKVGTIVEALRVHHDTVRLAIATEPARQALYRPSQLDAFVPLIRDTLAQYPRLRATRLHEMLRSRGYPGSAVQVRRLVRILRPSASPTAYLRLRTLKGEQAQVDWGAFGTLRIGRGTRPLSGFVMVLSYSRAIHAAFTLDQTLESFVRGHVEAFETFQGSARTILYDNLKSAVLARQGSAIHFHPRLLELAGHYHFAPRPCAPARGNEKGKVERQIQYLRHAFFAARTFRTLDDLHAQFRTWRDTIAHQRRHPDHPDRTVAEVLAEEQPVLLPLPAHPFETALVRAVAVGKTPYVRFDRNLYTVPHAYVQRTVTILADAATVRIVDGPTELACHVRSFGTADVIEDAAHLQALRAAKTAAGSATSRDRLLHAVPISSTLLEQYVLRGDTGHLAARRLLGLLEHYGPEELHLAIQDVLARGAFGPGAVAHILEQRRRRRGHPPPIGIVLSDRTAVRDLDVAPHALETYDALSRSDPADTDK